jgi:hypothetical protein
MATMNFSIPENVKERFNQTFANANKSAVVTKLLEEAIEHAERKQRSEAAAQRILAGFPNRTPITEEEFRQAREEGRH